MENIPLILLDFPKLGFKYVSQYVSQYVYGQIKFFELFNI